jgi:dTDP-4-amino-4,6-dideoxygalactose transaminase
MQVPFLDLSDQYLRIRGEIEQCVLRTLASGSYILGEEVAAFEREFAAYCGARHAVGVGSGTEAIHLALRAAGVGPGDEVITAPNTAAPTVCAIVAAGARPIFVDVEPRNLTLDPERLEDCLRAQPPSSRLKAIVPVHLYGHPADMAAVRGLAAEYGLKVLEDAAQAHGAEFDGQRVGSLGDAGCFSFYPTKNLGCYGDGGMVVTNDAEIAESVRMLRNYGEEAKFQNRIWGTNSRLDEIQAAILRVKLPHLDQWNSVRRDRARLYGELLGGSRFRLPVEVSPARHSFHLYVIRSHDRDALKRELSELGIGTAVHYPKPIHFQDAYRGLAYAAGDFPVAERAAREILSLPLFPELAEDQVRFVCSALMHPRRASPWNPANMESCSTSRTTIGGTWALEA